MIESAKKDALKPEKYLGCAEEVVEKCIKAL